MPFSVNFVVSVRPSRVLLQLYLDLKWATALFLHNLHMSNLILSDSHNTGDTNGLFYLVWSYKCIFQKMSFCAFVEDTVYSHFKEYWPVTKRKRRVNEQGNAAEELDYRRLFVSLFSSCPYMLIISFLYQGLFRPIS